MRRIRNWNSIFMQGVGFAFSSTARQPSTNTCAGLAGQARKTYDCHWQSTSLGSNPTNLSQY